MCTPHCWWHLVLVQPLPTIHIFYQSLEKKCTDLRLFSKYLTVPCLRPWRSKYVWGWPFQTFKVLIYLSFLLSATSTYNSYLASVFGKKCTDLRLSSKYLAVPFLRPWRSKYVWGWLFQTFKVLIYLSFLLFLKSFIAMQKEW
jgi:hypothetical protein